MRHNVSITQAEETESSDAAASYAQTAAGALQDAAGFEVDPHGPYHSAVLTAASQRLIAQLGKKLHRRTGHPASEQRTRHCGGSWSRRRGMRFGSTPVKRPGPAVVESSLQRSLGGAPACLVARRQISSDRWNRLTRVLKGSSLAERVRGRPGPLDLMYIVS